VLRKRLDGFKCFKCGEPEHRAVECGGPSGQGPSHRIGRREEDTSLICDGKPQIDEEENVELTDVELTGDVGPLLVVRRACPRDTEGESWLRNNIFQSTCTVIFADLSLIRAVVKM
jgi:hypothetical protein